MFDTDDEDAAFDKEFGRLVVERRVYDAGSEILKSAALGKAAFSVAEQRQDECRDKGDDAGAAFWQKVWNFLMDKCNANAGAEEIILEEGEEWDAENEEVIRPGKNPPRRNTGS